MKTSWSADNPCSSAIHSYLSRGFCLSLIARALLLICRSLFSIFDTDILYICRSHFSLRKLTSSAGIAIGYRSTQSIDVSITKAASLRPGPVRRGFGAQLDPHIMEILFMRHMVPQWQWQSTAMASGLHPRANERMILERAIVRRGIPPSIAPDSIMSRILRVVELHFVVVSSYVKP